MYYSYRTGTVTAPKLRLSTFALLVLGGAGGTFLGLLWGLRVLV